MLSPLLGENFRNATLHIVVLPNTMHSQLKAKYSLSLAKLLVIYSLPSEYYLYSITIMMI